MQLNSAVAIGGSVEEAGQWNLLSGELEPLRTDGEVPETGWLFDPDFGLVLPEDVAGRQVIIDEGLSLAFPITYNATHKPPVRSDGTSARSF